MVLNTSTCFRYLNVTFVEMYGIGWWRWGRHTWLLVLVLGTRAHLGLVALNPRDTWPLVPSCLKPKEVGTCDTCE